jgi:hypothetical protein
MYRSIKVEVGDCRKMMKDLVAHYGSSARATSHAGIGFRTYKRVMHPSTKTINHNSLSSIKAAWLKVMG